MILPEIIKTEAQLDELLTQPSDALIHMMQRLSGDIIILGIAGKMGFHLGVLAVRAIKKAGLAAQGGSRPQSGTFHRGCGPIAVSRRR